MDDRQLLELAAKAAGLTEHSEWADQIKDYDSPHYMSFALHKPGIGGQADSWNPLTDDGDALRLAVKLKIEIVISDHSATAIVDMIGCSEPLGADHDAATRRAIVRAAAEIGRQMP